VFLLSHRRCLKLIALTVSMNIFNSMASYKSTITDIAILIELQHPAQTTKPFAISQRLFFKNLMYCLNQFRKLKSLNIYIQMHVRNVNSDAAWGQFSDAVNFYRLKFVDWELWLQCTGQKMGKVEMEVAFNDDSMASDSGSRRSKTITPLSELTLRRRNKNLLLAAQSLPQPNQRLLQRRSWPFD
jgi:hypothetical protein